MTVINIKCLRLTFPCFATHLGSWLGALSKLCDPATNSPAFSDFPFTHSSPSIRAGEIGSHAKAFLITHAHLDHILGMVLGSASLPGKRAVYGLRSTLDNLLGIFDGKLWPKLASLDDNAPFIVYHCRPIECQKTIHLDETISVLPFALSHGLNMSTVPEPPTPAPQPLSAACYFSKRYSLPLNSLMGASPTPPLERALPDSGGSPFSGFNRTTFTSPFAPDRSSNAAFAAAIDMERSNSSSAASSPRIVQSEMSDQATSLQAASRGPLQRPAKSRRPKTASGSEKAEPPVSDLQPIISNDTESSDSPESAGGRNGSHPSRGSKFDLARDVCNGNGSAPGSTTTTTTPHHHTHTGGGATMDSTAFFLTNKETGQEVLFFGDVEPDCVSRSPRNRRVWQHAASRFAVDRLNTVFLECSFPAAQPTEFLWGHLSTSHLYDELKVLARCVKSERAVLARTERTTKRDVSSAPPRMVNFSKPLLNGPLPVIPSSPLGATSHSTPADLHGVLKGLTVIVIHAKQAFFPSYSGGGEGEEGSSGTASSPSSSRKGSRVLDPRTMQERILQELEEMEEENGLGVRFVMSKQGMRIGEYVVMHYLQHLEPWLTPAFCSTFDRDLSRLVCAFEPVVICTSVSGVLYVYVYLYFCSSCSLKSFPNLSKHRRVRLLGRRGCDDLCTRAVGTIDCCCVESLRC